MTEKKSPHEEVLEVLTPIFSKEMGNRLRIIRMKLLLDQGELAAKLGLTQQQVSAMETGRSSLLRHPVPASKLREALGSHFLFVMLGRNPERYPVAHINKAYWEHKDAKKGNRTKHRMTEAERTERNASYKFRYVNPRG